MIVVGHHAAIHMHAKTVGERIETAGVFGCNDVSALQQRNEACGSVGSIADRRGRQHDRALRNVGSAHESVKSRIAVCVFIFTFALVFAFALIHAFHAFSLSNAKENSPPSVPIPPLTGRITPPASPTPTQTPSHWRNPDAHKTKNGKIPPVTGRIFLQLHAHATSARHVSSLSSEVDTLRLFVQIYHPSGVTKRCIREPLVG